MHAQNRIPAPPRTRYCNVQGLHVVCMDGNEFLALALLSYVLHHMMVRLNCLREFMPL